MDWGVGGAAGRYDQQGGGECGGWQATSEGPENDKQGLGRMKTFTVVVLRSSTRKQAGFTVERCESWVVNKAVFGMY